MGRSSRNAQRRRRLARLHASNPDCYWCGEPTLLIDQHPSDHSEPKRATIDHLRDKFDPTRSEPARPGEVRTVLACWACNQERSRERQKEHADLQAYKSHVGHSGPIRIRRVTLRLEAGDTMGSNPDTNGHLYPDLAQGLGRLLQSTMDKAADNAMYWDMRKRLLVEVANLALDLAESDSRLEIGTDMLRARIERIAAIANPSEDGGALHDPRLGPPPRQVPQYNMREVLARADAPPEYAGHTQGYTQAPHANPPGRPPWPYPSQQPHHPNGGGGRS